MIWKVLEITTPLSPGEPKLLSFRGTEYIQKGSKLPRDFPTGDREPVQFNVPASEIVSVTSFVSEAFHLKIKWLLSRERERPAKRSVRQHSGDTGAGRQRTPEKPVCGWQGGPWRTLLQLELGFMLFLHSTSYDTLAMLGVSLGLRGS